MFRCEVLFRGDQMIKTKFNTINVDNQSDLKKAKIAMKNDRYFKSYCKNF